MNKIKVVPFDDSQKRSSKLTERYFNIAHWELLTAIKLEILHPKNSLGQRKKAYKDFRNIIGFLRPLFKEIVIELNRIARKRGYRNHFEFIVEKESLPEKKLQKFFNTVDKVIREINKNLPLSAKTPEWYWSKFNIPDALYRYRNDYKLKIPDDIYDLVIKFKPEVRKIKNSIKIEELKGINPTARYNWKNKTVTIEVPKKESIYNALTFVHELGHAINFVKLVGKKIEPFSKSRYWHEKQAFKFKFEFEENALPEKVKNASRGEILNDFSSTFFEYDIYTNPNQDFDKAYAKAINRCYPGKSNQKSNPFYVLENGFIFRPCGTLTASVVQTELLLEKVSK